VHEDLNRENSEIPQKKTLQPEQKLGVPSNGTIDWGSRASVWCPFQYFENSIVEKGI